MQVRLNDNSSPVYRAMPSKGGSRKPDHRSNDKRKREANNMGKCGAETEVYSRVSGYFRPVKNWNKGKRSEFKDRKTYDAEKAKGKVV